MNTSRNNLPDIDFAVKDTETILSELIADFQEVAGRKLYPGDPLRLLLLSFAKYIVLLRNNIDFAAKQNLLKYAKEGYLENIAALLDVSRLEPAAAITTLKFTLSIPQVGNIIIPKGTRASPGNKIYFATVENAEIPAGELSVEVTAECTENGEIGNNFYPGQINVLSDPFPYFFNVENTTVSQGGADMESVESLRERTRIAPESFSSAGPYGAYIFWAKSASQLITDVAVNSPAPAVVEIIPLLVNGEIPTDDILSAVYEECSDIRRRPLTDHVVVRAPDEVKYNIELKYYISRQNAINELTIINKVNEAVHNYVIWQKSALGRDINPSKLIEMVMESGAKRVEVISPQFRPIQYFELAVADEQSITYGRLEDD